MAELLTLESPKAVHGGVDELLQMFETDDADDEVRGPAMTKKQVRNLALITAVVIAGVGAFPASSAIAGTMDASAAAAASAAKIATVRLAVELGVAKKDARLFNVTLNGVPATLNGVVREAELQNLKDARHVLVSALNGSDKTQVTSAKTAVSSALDLAAANGALRSEASVTLRTSAGQSERDAATAASQNLRAAIVNQAGIPSALTAVAVARVALITSQDTAVAGAKARAKATAAANEKSMTTAATRAAARAKIASAAAVLAAVSDAVAAAELVASEEAERVAAELVAADEAASELSAPPLAAD